MLPFRLSAAIVGDAERLAIENVLKTAYFGMGEETELFEQEVAAFLGIEPKQAIAVNSGTAALTLAVDAAVAAVYADYQNQLSKQYLDQGSYNLPYSEKPQVLVPTLTFVASFQAIVAANCQPIACDVKLETATIDLDDAAKRLTDKTIAIMPVLYAGNPYGLTEVRQFAKKHNLRVIEDAAHAFGSAHKNQKIGSTGDLVCFSFDGIKNITCGEGGMLIAFNDRDIIRATESRVLGLTGQNAVRFTGQKALNPDVSHCGWRFHLSNILAAIGRCQLQRLEKEFAPIRRNLASLYQKRLENLPNLALLQNEASDYIIPQIMVIRILEQQRDKVKNALQKAGVPTGLHYRPNHLLSIFRPAKHLPPLPKSEQLATELLTLPLHTGLNEAIVNQICDIIEEQLITK